MSHPGHAPVSVKSEHTNWSNSPRSLPDYGPRGAPPAGVVGNGMTSRDVHLQQLKHHEDEAGEGNVPSWRKKFSSNSS